MPKQPIYKLARYGKSEMKLNMPRKTKQKRQNTTLKVVSVYMLCLPDESVV